MMAPDQEKRGAKGDEKDRKDKSLPIKLHRPELIETCQSAESNSDQQKQLWQNNSGPESMGFLEPIFTIMLRSGETWDGMRGKALIGVSKVIKAHRSCSKSKMQLICHSQAIQPHVPTLAKKIASKFKA